MFLVYYVIFRHREMAPEKYKQMDERLRTDPRLSAINNRH